MGEPKPVGRERCDESRRARLCWTRALVEYRNRRAVQSAHSRHGNQAVAEVEKVSWQDGCYEIGERSGDAGGRIRRSTWHVAEDGEFGTGDEMRSDWCGVRPSQKNQTCGQKARSTPMISAKSERQPECQHSGAGIGVQHLRENAPIRLSLAAQEAQCLGWPRPSATEPGAGVDGGGLNPCCCLLQT